MDDLGSAYKMPPLDEFAAQLTREQENLAHMGQLKPSKYQTLVANESTLKASKDQKQHKDPKQHEKGDDFPSQHNIESKSSLREETSRIKRDKCAYCKKIGHDDHKGFHKKIDVLTHIFQKKNIHLPSSVSTPSAYQATSTSTSLSKGKGQALIASTHPKKGKWLLDSGASHHMSSSMDMFSYIEPCTSPPILMGNNTYMKVCGKGSIPMGEGTFDDVLCVPSLTTNLLSIYQITRGEQGKIVEFTLDYVYIRDMENKDVISMGVVDHKSRLYSFEYFFDNDDDIHDVSNPLSRVNYSCEKNIGHLSFFS